VPESWKIRYQIIESEEFAAKLFVWRNLAGHSSWKPLKEDNLSPEIPAVRGEEVPPITLSSMPHFQSKSRNILLTPSLMFGGKPVLNVVEGDSGDLSESLEATSFC
jgi:hypothetical protein